MYGHLIERQPILASLIALRDNFKQEGFDIRLVGGCVRDMLVDIVPHDFDLCTDATPDEQQAIYEKYNVRHIGTGLQHGTWTVVIDSNVFEITSLRTETNHDGRHAEVSYIRDWDMDLARRDFSINAMTLTLDGVLHDLFNGLDDLRHGRVVFVGQPIERITEDYLRILRWLRFHARFTTATSRADLTLDAETVATVIRNDVQNGLGGISRERVWSEIAKIITGPHGIDMVRAINCLGLCECLDLPVEKSNFSTPHMNAAFENGCQAATIMSAYCGNDVEKLANDWKWSSAEKNLALFIAKNINNPEFCSKEAKRLIAVDNVDPTWVSEMLMVLDMVPHANDILVWTIPTFPVTGADMKKIGINPGPQMGKTLKMLRAFWAISDYSVDKDTLLALVR